MKTKEEIDKIYLEVCKDYGSKEIASEYCGFTKGYLQCQEDMAERKLGEDDIKEMALDYIIDAGGLPKTIEEWQNDLWKFYQSLNKQD